MKMYVGRRTKRGYKEVFIIGHDGDSRKLPLYRNLVNHSPDGFEWGFGGAGPAQLAFALCYNAIGDIEIARTVYQEFKRRHIATLRPRGDWRMSEQTVMLAIAAIVKEYKRAK
jgi:Family of unknown function (DUF6166)